MNSKPTSYRGRFAPSPTGPLHAGSLVAALASWLDAKAHGGRWLVRIEDVDTSRCIPGTDRLILQQLADVGLVPDEPPVYQSQRSHLYQQALDQLIVQHQAYPCNCSRKEIAEAAARTKQIKERHGELVYPGTCRAGMNQQKSTKQVAWRLLTAGDIEAQVGDFVLKRADGLWAYQLAVVVDDALQGINHVVRGADLTDNTPRQIALQQALGYPTPHYLHTPLVLAADGEKLSKQNGAKALDVNHPLTTLNSAATVLGLTAQYGSVTDALATWTAEWRSLYNSTRD